MKLSETEYLSARNNTLELVTFIKFHPSPLPGEVGEGSTRRRVAHQKMNLLLRLESFRPLRQKVSKLEGAAISYFNPVPWEGGLPKSTVPAESERTAVQVENVPRRDVTIYNVVC